MPPTGAPSLAANAPEVASGGAVAVGAAAKVLTVAARLPSPDDVATGPDGSIYVSDIVDGTIRQITPGGKTTVLVRRLSEPEGIVVLPGGELIIAEQGNNRLLSYNPATGETHLLLQLQNRTGRAGVDGIGLDDRPSAGLALIVPDSANGTVLRVSLDGKQVETLGSGFVRPVAALVEHDGSVLVADEFGHRLARIRPDGRTETVTRLPGPDDLIEDQAGHIYVNTLTDGAIHEIDALSGADRVVLRGLGALQGIAFDGPGTIVAAVPAQHRVVQIRLP